jgi:hypothetical protein
VDDYVIDGDLVFSDQRSALKFYREQYHKKKEWQGLTDEEMMQIYVALKSVAGFYSLEKYARAIEAKLKEKNG